MPQCPFLMVKPCQTPLHRWLAQLHRSRHWENWNLRWVSRLLPDPRTQTWAVLLCALTLNQRQIGTSGWFWGVWVCWLVWSYVDVQFYPHVFMAISPPVVQWVIAIAKQQLNHTLKAVSRQCWVVKWANQSQSILVMFNSLHDLNIESL